MEQKESSAASECGPLIIVGFQIDFLIVKIGRGFLFKYYDRYFFFFHFTSYRNDRSVSFKATE